MTATTGLVTEDVKTLARVIWSTSRRDEGTISATGAAIIAQALIASGAVRLAAEVRAEAIASMVPPGPCWHDPGTTWPNGVSPRCELRAGHAGAHECDRGQMGGTAVWTDR